MAKRWDQRTATEIENSKVQEFLDEIIQVYKKHRMSIGHEDTHGGFLIHNFDEYYEKWLQDASIPRDFEETQ